MQLPCFAVCSPVVGCSPPCSHSPAARGHGSLLLLGMDSRTGCESLLARVLNHPAGPVRQAATNHVQGLRSYPAGDKGGCSTGPRSRPRHTTWQLLAAPSRAPPLRHAGRTHPSPPPPTPGPSRGRELPSSVQSSCRPQQPWLATYARCSAAAPQRCAHGCAHTA